MEERQIDRYRYCREYRVARRRACRVLLESYQRTAAIELVRSRVTHSRSHLGAGVTAHVNAAESEDLVDLEGREY